MCQHWLATDKDDGQIARELVPHDPRRKASMKDVALEDKGMFACDEVLSNFRSFLSDIASIFVSSPVSLHLLLHKRCYATSLNRLLSS
jgi:hypothetical protein